MSGPPRVPTFRSQVHYIPPGGNGSHSQVDLVSAEQYRPLASPIINPGAPVRRTSTVEILVDL